LQEWGRITKWDEYENHCITMEYFLLNLQFLDKTLKMKVIFDCRGLSEKSTGDWNELILFMCKYKRFLTNFINRNDFIFEFIMIDRNYNFHSFSNANENYKVLFRTTDDFTLCNKCGQVLPKSYEKLRPYCINCGSHTEKKTLIIFE